MFNLANGDPWNLKESKTKKRCPSECLYRTRRVIAFGHSCPEYNSCSFLLIHIAKYCKASPNTRSGGDVERELPQSICCDNGPEMTRCHFLACYMGRESELVHILPGEPTQNVRVESLYGRMREELLRGNRFEQLFHARRKIADWRKDHNEQRPHSSQSYKTPSKFAAQATGLYRTE